MGKGKPKVVPVNHEARALKTRGHPHDEERRDAGRVLNEVEIRLRCAEEEKEQELDHLPEMSLPTPLGKAP